ncbi:MAG: ankyrin repeat domain-containing protein [Rickettsiales bacterium]|jgi:ankyrin repeat protein|nr:ankyrin repeat domain-containing protein [Rickettsiales bacterium]
MAIEIRDLERMYENGRPLDEIHAGFAELIAENPPKEVMDRMVVAAARGFDAAAMKLLMDAGVTAQWADDYGHTLFHLPFVGNANYYTPPAGAAAEFVNFLLDRGVSVLRRDSNRGLYPYHYAAAAANLEFVRALNARGAKMTLSGKDGVTALHELAKAFQSSGSNTGQKPELAEKFIHTAEVLIAAGVDIDAKNDSGRTAADIAIEYKSAGIFMLLSSNPTVFQAIKIKSYDDACGLAANNPNAISDGRTGEYRGMTALGAAVYEFDERAVGEMFDAGADANFKNDGGDGALCGLFTGRAPHPIFKDGGIGKILDQFAAKGWDVNAPIDGDGNTLLCRAAKSNFEKRAYNDFTVEGEIFKWIWPRNPDVNVANARGVTPLMLAANGDDAKTADVVVTLLERGADVAARDADGRTALHYAAANGSQNMAKNTAEMIFAFGAIDANIADNKGRTALDIATENGHEELVKFLLGQM